MAKKTYEVFFPVYKQGDDFGHCLDVSKGSVKDAFLKLSANYETASEIAKKLASVAAEIEMEAYGNTHYVSVTGEESLLAPLVKDGYLEVPYTEEDEEEDEGVL